MSDEPIEAPSDPDTPGDRDASRDIAVVGMAGRFPGARDLAQLWRNLHDGVESVTWLSNEELLAAGTAPELLANSRFVRAASLLDRIESFDAPFFGYSAHEAAIMDPQQRLFLEHAWAALEDAGHLPARFDGLIGVYAGVAWNTYLLSNLTTHPELFAGGGGFQVFITNDKDFMPTRVSYKLDLKGPSLIVQTSCSTSLVATHLACLSLLNYECDMALAGGVTVRVPQHQGYLYLDGGLASPDGHCRSFDAAAAGTIFGSGVGVVVLRRLADALAGGDHIQAVIKGSAINNDGSLKVSYTAPSVEGQSEVIAAAQAIAGIDPETIGYVEAHGTATALGDPVEVMALTRVFRERTAKTGFCGLGSIKSNFGHLDAAAGVAGLIKTILALKHRQIPPSLHFETPNPAIDFAASPFYVNAKLADWPRNETLGTPRRAAVSSFGVGGTNAHVILEEAPEPKPAAPARPWQLLVLSARSEEALEAATDRLADRLGPHPPSPPLPSPPTLPGEGGMETDLADIAYTLRTGRAVFRHRRMLVCAAGENPADLLRRRDPGEVLTAVDDEDPRTRPVVFLFPGQGAQHVGMGRGLYAEEPVFRDAIDRSAELLLPHLGLDLRRLLWPPPEETDETNEAARRLQQTELTQPALFAVELALAQLWMSWGVQPQALLGHSLGELTAACLAGVFSLADAHALVAARGRLIAELPPGAMLSLPLSETEIAPLLTSDLALAAVNEPGRSVVSGPESAVKDLEARLDARGVRSRRLHTSHAFHSPMMESAVAPFTAAVRRCSLTPPHIPFLSNVTGTWITPEQATDPAYWGRQLRQPVRFAAAVSELLREPRRILLEAGPGRTLSTAAGRHPERQGQPVIASLGHPQDTAPEGKHLLTALGRLWLAGLDLDPALYYAGETRRRVPLPTYPFERQRYWIEPGIRPIGPIRPIESTPETAEITKRPDPADWFYLPVFRPAEPLTATQGPPRRVLVIAPERMGTALAQTLAGAGHEVVTAGIENLEDIAALRAGGFVPEVVVHAGTLGQAAPVGPHPPNPPLPAPTHPPGEGGMATVNAWQEAGGGAPLPVGREGMGEGSGVRAPAAFEAAQEHGLYSLLTLARELAPTAEQQIDLVVVTDHLLSVTGGEPVHPEKAPVLGFCRVLPLEQPGISCRCLDVALPAPGSRQEAQILDLLAAEVMAHGGEEVVAVRGLQRWVPAFEPLRLPATAAPKPLLREGGVYLLTGGLEGNGFALARWLARTARARLALLESPGATSRPERVRALEELGGAVLVVTADHDETDLRRALATAAERFGPLHGVLHAAGLHGEQAFQPIAEAGRTGCALSFSAKVHPLFALERALAGLDLDFCMLLSSLTAQLGGVANVADCAANLVLDAFARRHNRGPGTPWLSLEWDVWDLGGNEAGQITALRRDLAALAMSPEEGEAAFRHALALAAACPLADVVTVSTGDLTARLAERRRRRHATPRATRTRAAATPHPRPLATPFSAPVSELEQRIATLWQEALGYAPIGLDDNFFELGGDSFVAVQVVSRLRDELRIEISAARLYQGLTVRALAALIAGTIGGEEKPRSEDLEERRASMSRRQEFQERRRAGRRGADE